MKRGLTMALVGKKMTFAEGEDERLDFWANKTWIERLNETERLRRMIWTQLLGSYPDKMQKVGRFVKLSELEE